MDEWIKNMWYTYTHIHTMEYCSDIKKEWNCVICNHPDGPWGYYVKWSKSDREGQTPYYFIHMWKLKTKQRNKQNKTKQTHRYREQVGGYQRGRDVRGGKTVWRSQLYGDGWQLDL